MHVYNKLNEVKKEEFKDQVKKPQNWTWTIPEVETAKHKVSIMDLIWSGINPPKRVLSCYPDIIKKFKKEIEENDL